MNQYPPAIVHSQVAQQQQNGRRCIFWGWILVGSCCLLAIIPFVGLLAWFVGPPLLIAALILAIIGMASSQPGRGVFLLLFTLIVGSLTVALGPLVSSFLAAVLTGAAVEPSSSSLEQFGDMRVLESYTPGN